MVADMSDEEIWGLQRGGHDPQKVYAAYHAAVHHRGQPTVILAKTVKGYGLGKAGESINIAHQMKKPGREAVQAFRDRYRIPIPDESLDEVPFHRPDENSPEIQYLRERREELGGFLPQRHVESKPLSIPSFETFRALTESTGDREISTTMAFVRILTALTRDKSLAPHIVPIVPDEARTFGMEGLFRTLGIYAAKGQLYDPVDADQVMYYKEDAKGQILEEGITEAGATASWIAAGTSYANHGVQMVPFYIFYSMFGFQRVGDLLWAAGDSQTRGFLLGGTSGRTTLAGEGLQHQDGHSQPVAATVPNCRAYDPTFHYELAVILHDGLERMYRDGENVFYYVTVMNENYTHPAMPADVRDGIVKGMYLLSEGPKQKLRVQLLGSGAILREVIAAAELLEQDWGVSADVWSVTSFNELRREGLDTHRHNLMNPEQAPRLSYVEQCLGLRQGPVVASTDYIRSYADQIRQFVPHRFAVLGTDGYGRSDTRAKLREFFEVDRHHVVVVALKALADDGELPAATVREAFSKYGIDTKKPNPVSV
jgi:pyruvate dehydrogenase E1 component